VRSAIETLIAILVNATVTFVFARQTRIVVIIFKAPTGAAGKVGKINA
jgi:hypothetical protein